MSWSLVTNATHAVEGWEAEANRLREQLVAVGTVIAAEHSPLVWRSADHGVDWSEPESIAAAMSTGQIRDESPNPKIMTGLGSSGTVQGYTSDAERGLVSVQWHVGGTGQWQFHASYDFATGDPDGGTARVLSEYDPAWLARLLGAAALAVRADQARITETRAHRALRKARREAARRVGVMTLVLNGAETAPLPEGVIAYPWSDGYPNGVILGADTRSAHTPADLVPTMLKLDDYLMTRN